MKAPKLGTRRWSKRRKEILVRDLGQCRYQYPGCLGTASQVDHYHPRSWGGNWWDGANLYSVCVPCHREKERRMRNGETLALRVTEAGFLEQEAPEMRPVSEIPPRNTRYLPITADYSRKRSEERRVGKECR